MEIVEKHGGDVQLTMTKVQAQELRNMLAFVSEKYSQGRTMAEKRHAERIREHAYQLSDEMDSNINW